MIDVSINVQNGGKEIPPFLPGQDDMYRLPSNRALAAAGIAGTAGMAMLTIVEREIIDKSVFTMLEPTLSIRVCLIVQVSVHTAAHCPSLPFRT